MYRRIQISIGAVITIVVSAFLFIVMVGMFLQHQGTITIERPYLDEYNQCQEDFKVLETSKTPSCTSCKCSPSASGIFFSIFGGIIFIGGIIFWLGKEKEFEKREKELRKQELLAEKKARRKTR